MNLLILIIVGAVAGLVASTVMGTHKGLLIDIIVGILGSVIGGWIMNFFNYGGVSGFNLYSFLVALGGAILLLAIVKAIRH
jgi:uncharacterized membrane protein YeaQ/YmgE (transglycosylase-associated protein family)